MAFVQYSPKWQGKRAESISHDKAKAILHAIYNPEVLAELSESQIDYLNHIERDERTGKPAIYFGKQAKVEKVMDTTHLTNEGIQQGMYSAIPNGDR